MPLVPAPRLRDVVEQLLGCAIDFDFVVELDGHFGTTLSLHAQNLRSQIVTLETGPGRHRKYLPYVFTEHGAIMAATLLNSPRAVEVSVYVVRAFVQLREFLASNKELARQLKALEQRIERKLGSHDQAIAGIIDTLRQLTSPATAKRRIGFVIDEEK
ncbi:MAG: ORF6N domain-containing protein [Betaproteobacteria bacterium]|nr:ORF6N domain-containing protein [Betaproteobacteria bacterium]